MASSLFRPLVALAGLAVLVGLPHPGRAEATRYPLTLQNCGHTLTFQKAPARTVAIGQSSTEILYLLGLADRVVGTAVWVGPVLKGYEAANAKVERLADNDPSFEKVLATKPDLVAVQFQYQVGPHGDVAKPEQFEDLGIPVYTSPADCEGKDNTPASDGVRHEPFAMDMVYHEVRDLAAVFDARDRGEAIVADLKAREAAARAKVASAHGKLSAVFWFSSQKDADPYVAGRNGAPAYIMAALGLRNIIGTEDEWPNVGWETIAKADPSVIVAAAMDRRRYPLDSVEAKRAFLTSDPVTSLMPAVKAGHVFTMDAQSMNPTIRTIEGIETLADQIAAAGLTR